MEMCCSWNSLVQTQLHVSAAGIEWSRFIDHWWLGRSMRGEKKGGSHFRAGSGRVSSVQSDIPWPCTMCHRMPWPCTMCQGRCVQCPRSGGHSLRLSLHARSVCFIRHVYALIARKSLDSDLREFLCRWSHPELPPKSVEPYPHQ